MFVEWVTPYSKNIQGYFGILRIETELFDTKYVKSCLDLFVRGGNYKNSGTIAVGVFCS